MTATELISHLKQYPQDAQVVVAGYENGFDDIENIKELLLSRKEDKQWWDGKYQKQTEDNGVKAIALLGDRNRE